MTRIQELQEEIYDIGFRIYSEKTMNYDEKLMLDRKRKALREKLRRLENNEVE